MKGLTVSPRDYTEVSLLIRHSLLRQLGTGARTQLLAPNTYTPEAIYRKEWALLQLINELEEWRTSSVITPYPTNSYETVEYFDVNFHRERIKLFSALILPNNADSQQFTPKIEHCLQCLLSAAQIISSYQSLSRSGLLVTNWTYVQDILKSGFIILSCGVQIPKALRQNQAEASKFHTRDLLAMSEAIKSCREILVMISAQWQTVNPHRIAFEKLSEEVSKLLEKSLQQSRSALEGNSDQGASPSLAFQWDFDLFDSALDMQPMEDIGFTDVELNELFGLDLPLDGVIGLE